MQSIEQDARELLEKIGVEDAQSFSSGDLVVLTNLLSELYTLRSAKKAEQQHLLTQEVSVVCSKCGTQNPLTIEVVRS